MKRVEDVLEKKGGNYILPFFWQHGEDEATLRHYVRVIRDAQIGAFCVESRPHPDFCGPKWWQDMDAILDEAGKAGMQVWILDDSHFPTGYANGAVKTADSALCHLYLDYRTLEICGPRFQVEIDAASFAHPEPLPPYMPQPPKPERVFDEDQIYRVVACEIEAGNRIGRCLDLTDTVTAGRLVMDVPVGYWRIYVIYTTRDANGRNNYINMLDKQSCRLLIDAVYEPHFARYGKYFGNIIAGFFSDEPPIGNTPGYTAGDLIGNPKQSLPWSAQMEDRMTACFGGSDWGVHLPMLWSEATDDGMKAKMRVAYMDSVSLLVKENFSEQNGSWCEEHGVEYIGHMLEDMDMHANMGPSMGHFFRGLMGQHMSGIDNIGGQVLIGGQDTGRMSGSGCQDEAGFYHYELGKLGASLAAIDPKKKGRCLCENFGAYGWQCGVKTQKYLLDHFMVRGVNVFVPHAFSPAAFPDPDCPPHFYANGENPQYRAFGELMGYTNRVCHLISAGVSVQTAALLYHGESQWGGDYSSNIHAARRLTQAQIDFHILPADVFSQREDFQTHFDGKILSVNGRVYNILVLSGNQYLYAPAARFIREASGTGFPILFVDRLPQGIVGLEGEEAAEIMDIVASCPVVPIDKLTEAVHSWVAADVRLEAPFRNLTVYHYRTDVDLYLFLNEDPALTFDGKITLAQKGGAIEYDAWENRIKPVNVTAGGEGTDIHITLEPLEMKIIVMGAQGATLEAMQQQSRELELFQKQIPEASTNGLQALSPMTSHRLKGFKVSKAETTHYPKFSDEQYFEFPENMATKYPDFSGYFRYRTTFELEKAQSCSIEIDDVYESAQVWLNGKPAGHRVSRPYRYDLSELVKAGENELVIETATTLERKVAAMGRDIYSMGKKAPLAPSGIIGNVWLHVMR